jgi:hypothetical protein
LDIRGRVGQYATQAMEGRRVRELHAGTAMLLSRSFCSSTGIAGRGLPSLVDRDGGGVADREATPRVAARRASRDERLVIGRAPAVA